MNLLNLEIGQKMTVNFNKARINVIRTGQKTFIFKRKKSEIKIYLNKISEIQLINYLRSIFTKMAKPAYIIAVYSLNKSGLNTINRINEFNLASC